MDELWGQTVPAPAERVVAVEGNATIEAAGLKFVALDTPGHARHHHVFRLGDVAFTGDAAGVRLGDRHWIDLPGPPQSSIWERGRELSTVFGTRTSTSSTAPTSAAPPT